MPTELRPLFDRNHRRFAAREWVEDDITNEAEHSDQALRQSHWIRSRMQSRGGPRGIGPDLSEPGVMVGLPNYAQEPRG